MRVADTKREGDGLQCALSLVLGGLLALGLEMVILLLGSAAVLSGVFRLNASPQLTAAVCLCGCFIGGRLTCTRWKTRRLLGGILTGIVCFLFILLIALFSGKADIGIQGLIELSSCIVGGALAGTFITKRKKRGKKVR